MFSLGANKHLPPLVLSGSYEKYPNLQESDIWR